MVRESRRTCTGWEDSSMELSRPRLATALGILSLALLVGPTGTRVARAAGRADYQRGAGEVVLAKAGMPQVAIVAPKGAPAPVRFAARELKEHLDLMTGGSFPVLDSRPAHGRAIVLGDTLGARAAGIRADAIARDGYAIRTVGQTIYIAGRDDATQKSEALFAVTKPFPRRAGRYSMTNVLGAPTWDFERGTLYGVYRFLEELGVRWFFPGDKGRVIPRKPDLTVAAFSVDDEPAFVMRKVGRSTWQWYMLDSSRVKRVVNRKEYEDIGWGGNALRLWLLRVRHSSEWFAFNHRPVRMCLEERYGKTHPEYFAVRANGQRDLKPQKGRTGHLCYTHPAALEVAKHDIDAYFGGKHGKDMGFTPHRLSLAKHNRGWPWSAIYGRSVSLLPHDSFRGCECPNCLRITHRDKPRPHWHSELVWRFVVKVADWMKVAHPDKFIICLAYSSYSERPAFLKRLPENVVVGMCPAGYARTSNDVEEKAYQDMMRMVGEWSALNKRPMLIWLHHLYRYRNERRRGLPMLLTRLYERMFRDLIRRECGLYFAENRMSFLSSRIEKRINARSLRSFYGYYQYLQEKDIERRNELLTLLDMLTVNETAFFRNRPQFRLLEQVVLPEILEARASSPRRPLRIWSAGCATGQEPCSIAISVLDSMPHPRPCEFQIFASDLSLTALERADRGVYAAGQIDGIEPLRMSRYFETCPEGYRVREEVKRNVIYDFHNLKHENGLRQLDIIFCRNVLILLRPGRTEEGRGPVHSGARPGRLPFPGPCGIASRSDR